MLKSSFTSRDTALWKRLYKTYVRPELEFAVQQWNPYLTGDVKILEQVQHRVPHELKTFGYDERCAIFGITSLKERRMRGDLIQHFKFVRGIELVNWHHQIVQGERQRARLRRELVKNCDERFNWFGNRVASSWNAIPGSVISSDTVNQFKNRLDAIGDLLKLSLCLAR